MTGWRIVCDAGGTNVRLARSICGHVDAVRVLPTGPGLDLAAHLADFGRTFGGRDDLEGVAVAAAGPVLEAAVTLTNADVTIRAATVREVLHRPVALFNDLEAVAWALPHLAATDLHTILACDMPLEGGKLAINIGTGFGAALLIETAHGAHVCALEPGHMKIATAGGCDPDNVTARLSIEEVLSGLALGKPSSRMGFWRWPEGAGVDATVAFAAARDTRTGQRFITQFSALFGQVCGDLVLATGAWAGVYLTGSVVSSWRQAADVEAFRTAFIDKGPMLSRMARVPVHHIVAAHPALTGLAFAPLA